MPTTDVQISNMALGFIGVSQFIANLTTEKSHEADVCSLYYPQALESTLADFDWPDATKYATLGLVTDNSALTTPYDWIYAYRYPSDCIKVRRIVTSLGRRDPNPPSFRIGVDDQGKLILTNDPFGVVEYTKSGNDPSLFSPLFTEAVAWRLAGFIAPSMTRIKGMLATCAQVYVAVLAKAKVAAANEGQQDIDPESDFIRARY
jgi:hypothetical protein